MADFDDIRLREIEENIRALFEANDLVAITRLNAPAKFQQATPRAEIKAKIGSATGHQFVCPDGFKRFDGWFFQLGIQIVTRPQNTDANNKLNQQFVARTRGMMSKVGGRVTFDDTVNFPNLYIAEPLKDSGTEDNLKTDEGVEYASMGWTGIVCVRQTAWPTS